MKFVILVLFIAVAFAVASPSGQLVSAATHTTTTHTHTTQTTRTRTQRTTTTITIPTYTQPGYCDPTNPYSPCYNPCYPYGCGYNGYPSYYYGPPAYTTQIIYMTQTFFATSTATVSTTSTQMMQLLISVTSTLIQPVTDPFSVIALVGAGFVFAIVIAVCVNYLKKQKA
jgi:hypothetical protein